MSGTYDNFLTNITQNVSVTMTSFIVFYFFIVKYELHEPSVKETNWYQQCKILFENSKKKNVNLNKEGWIILKSFTNYAKRIKKTNEFWIPSGGVYGVVWFFIYFLLAIGSFLVWLAIWFDLRIVSTLDSNDYNNLIIEIAFFSILFANIICNKLWTLIFFKSKLYLFGLILIGIMILTDIVMVVLLFIVEAYVAAAFFIPYVLWLSYAFILNFIFYQNAHLFTEIWNQLCFEDGDYYLISYSSIPEKEKEKLTKDILNFKSKYFNLTKKIQPNPNASGTTPIVVTNAN